MDGGEKEAINRLMVSGADAQGLVITLRADIYPRLTQASLSRNDDPVQRGIRKRTVEKLTWSDIMLASRMFAIQIHDRLTSARMNSATSTIRIAPITTAAGARNEPRVPTIFGQPSLIFNKQDCARYKPSAVIGDRLRGALHVDGRKSVR